MYRLRQAKTNAAAEAAGTGGAVGADPQSAENVETSIRNASAAARADYIVTAMPAPLRAALELAYRERQDYRQAAAALGVTEDEARRRLRLGLQLLSTANDVAPQAVSPPRYGPGR